jgi:hypothetical protein
MSDVTQQTKAVLVQLYDGEPYENIPFAVRESIEMAEQKKHAIGQSQLPAPTILAIVVSAELNGKKDQEKKEKPLRG